MPNRQKTGVVVQGFRQADTGSDKTEPVASLEAALLFMALVAKNL